MAHSALRVDFIVILPIVQCLLSVSADGLTMTLHINDFCARFLYPTLANEWVGMVSLLNKWVKERIHHRIVSLLSGFHHTIRSANDVFDDLSRVHETLCDSKRHYGGTSIGRLVGTLVKHLLILAFFRTVLLSLPLPNCTRLILPRSRPSLMFRFCFDSRKNSRRARDIIYCSFLIF